MVNLAEEMERDLESDQSLGGSVASPMAIWLGGA